jgi:hypothetical protein
MNDYWLEPWACRTCGYVMNGASPLTGPGRPEDGDVSFCIMCAEMYRMDGGKFRPFTDDELIALPLDDKMYLGRIAQGIRDFHKQRKEEGNDP